MYKQVEKPKENKVRAIANTISQKHSSRESPFRFVDNRPEAVAQRKLQEVANKSPQSKQTTQLKEVGNNYSQVNQKNYTSHNPAQSITQFARGKKSKHDRKAGRLAKTQGIERSIPIEEERGFSVVSQSESTNPYTPSEITEILAKIKPGDLFDIDPSRIRTMHAGISNRFSNDDEIIDLVEKLKDDPSYIDKTPTIKVAAIELPKRKWERQDELEQRNTKELTLFTEDHRRVVAARMAGIKKMKAQMKADSSVTGNFTTKNRGLSVDVRKYHDTKEGRHQGGNKTTLPSSAKVHKYTESEE